MTLSDSAIAAARGVFAGLVIELVASSPQSHADSPLPGKGIGVSGVISLRTMRRHAHGHRERRHVDSKMRTVAGYPPSGIGTTTVSVASVDSSCVVRPKTASTGLTEMCHHHGSVLRH